MPKAEIPVSSAKIDAIGTYGPATWANVFYAVITTFDPDHLQDVAALCADAIANLFGASHIATKLADDWQLETTRVRFRDSTDSVYRATIASAVGGTGGATGEPAQVSYLIDWQTGDPRKGGKPRTYLVGVPDSAMTDSVRVDGGIRADMNAMLVDWIEANLTRTHGTASGIVFGEMSFVNAKADRTTPLFYPFIAGTVSPEVATQRRRVNRLRT